MKSSGFKFTKWTLITFCLFGIITTIVMVSLASALVDKYVDNQYNPFPQEIPWIKYTMKTIIYSVSIFALFIDFVGIIGAFKEYYFLSMFYAVLITLATIASVSAAVKNPYYWINTSMDFILCLISFTFVHQLRQRRLQEVHGHTHTHVIHIPGPLYPVNYTNQNYNPETAIWPSPAQDNNQHFYPPPPYYNVNKENII